MTDISHEQAKGAATRLIAGAFRRDGERLDFDKRPQFSTPCRPDRDDDTVIVAYIEQQAALVASQAARIRELEEGVRPLSLAASLMSGDPDDRVVSVGRWYDYDDGNPPRFGADVQLTVGHFRRARSLLSRKGGE